MSIAAGDVALGAAQGAKNSLNGLVPKTEHHYVAGALLLFVGVIGVAGSVTGTLASMIAGLFEPDALGTAGGTTNNTKAPPSLGSDAAKDVVSATNPLNFLNPISYFKKAVSGV